MPDDAGDVFFCDDDRLSTGGYTPLLEVPDVEELMVVRSVLAEAGIPFIVKGVEILPDGPAEKSGALSGGMRTAGPFRVDVPGEDHGDAREILMANVYQPVSELRARALEMKFLSGIIWSAVWSLTGFIIAFFTVPEDWEQESKWLVYFLSGLAALIAGNAIKGSIQSKQDIDGGPWVNG